MLAKGDYLVGLGESPYHLTYHIPIANGASTETPLAKGFDILKGRQEVTIPADTTPGDDYSVVCEYPDKSL